MLTQEVGKTVSCSHLLRIGYLRASPRQRRIGKHEEKVLEKVFVHPVSIRSISVLLQAILSEQHLSTSGRVASEETVFSFDMTHVESEVWIVRRLSQSHPMGLLPLQIT